MNKLSIKLVEVVKHKVKFDNVKTQPRVTNLNLTKKCVFLNHEEYCIVLFQILLYDYYKHF